MGELEIQWGKLGGTECQHFGITLDRGTLDLKANGRAQHSSQGSLRSPITCSSVVKIRFKGAVAHL